MRFPFGLVREAGGGGGLGGGLSAIPRVTGENEKKPHQRRDSLWEKIVTKPKVEGGRLEECLGGKEGPKTQGESLFPLQRSNAWGHHSMA